MLRHQDCAVRRLRSGVMPRWCYAAGGVAMAGRGRLCESRHFCRATEDRTLAGCVPVTRSVPTCRQARGYRHLIRLSAVVTCSYSRLYIIDTSLSKSSPLFIKNGFRQRSCFSKMLGGNPRMGISGVEKGISDELPLPQGCVHRDAIEQPMLLIHQRRKTRFGSPVQACARFP